MICIHNKPGLLSLQNKVRLWVVSLGLCCAKKSHTKVKFCTFFCAAFFLRGPCVSIKCNCSKQTNITSFALSNLWTFLGAVTCLFFPPFRIFICCNVSATCRSCWPDCLPSLNPAINRSNKQPGGCLCLCFLAFRRVSPRWRSCLPAPCRKPVLIAYHHRMWWALKHTTKTHSLLLFLFFFFFIFSSPCRAS